MVCASGTGQIFEVTGGAEPEVCWEFVSPWLYDGSVTNYLDDRDAFIDNVSLIQKGFMKNMLHRVYRYSPDFAGLKGRDLSKAKPISPDIVHLWEIEPYKSGLARARKLPWPEPCTFFLRGKENK